MVDLSLLSSYLNARSDVFSAPAIKGSGRFPTARPVLIRHRSGAGDTELSNNARDVSRDTGLPDLPVTGVEYGLQIWGMGNNIRVVI